MNKYSFVVLFIITFIIGCAAQQGTRGGTTPTTEVRAGTAVISTERLAELERHDQDRTRLIDEQVSETERQEALARAIEQRRAEIEAEAQRTARVETPVAPPVQTTPPQPRQSVASLEAFQRASRRYDPPGPAASETTPRPSASPSLDRLIEATRDYDRPVPTPRPVPPVASPQFLGGFGPPGMVSETQAYAGGSAPWQRYGGSTGGQELIVRVNSSYAIALALDGQMVQPIAGGMPIAVPAYSGGGITQVPVIPATRSGGWTGSGTTREYRILADSLGRRQLSWTCYSVVSGRAGRPVGQGARSIDIRTGTRVLINDTMCR